MKKIKYFCCLLGLVLTGLACQDDDETTVIPKPEGITYGTVTDKGGNIYKTLTIGNQTWQRISVTVQRKLLLPIWLLTGNHTEEMNVPYWKEQI